MASPPALLATVLLASLAAAPALADEPPAGERGAASAPAPAPAPATPPEDARGWEVPPGHDPEDVGLFLPRALLTIPRVTLTVVFWPLQQGLRFVERHAVIERVEDVLYNDARTAGIVPTLSYETSLGPTVGAKVFHDDLAGHDEALSLHAQFGGRYLQSYELRLDAARVLGSRYYLESLARFEVEPRLPFRGIGDPPVASGGAGLGPRDAGVETRFRETRLLSLLRLGYTIGGPGGLTQLGATAILNHRTFGASPDQAEPSIEEVYDTARLPGFDSGVRTLEIGAEIVVDTREPRGATSSGARVELFAGGVPPAGEYHFFHYGAEVTGYVDLYRGTRVLVLRAAHEGVTGDAQDTPFSELPRLGGPARLRGYPLDWFRDRTVALATVEYHYPIHAYVAGSLFVDAGRVAPDLERLVDLDDYRVGGGAGFLVRSRDRVFFTVDVAYGDGLNVYFTTDPLRAFAKRSELL